MVYNDAPVLKTENKLLLRYVGLTEDGLLEFAVLSGFTVRYNVARSPILTGETLFLANTEQITSLLRQPLDIIYIFGGFEILTFMSTDLLQ